MPMSIVKALEIVQIEHGETERRVSPPSAVKFADQSFFQVAPVKQSSQGIMDRFSAEFFAQFQIRQRELDRLADGDRQLQLTDLMLARVGRGSGKTKYSQDFTLDG